MAGAWYEYPQESIMRAEFWILFGGFHGALSPPKSHSPKNLKYRRHIRNPSLDSPHSSVSIEDLKWLKAAEEQEIPSFSFTPQEEEKRIYQAPFAREQSAEELIPLLYGNITEGTSMLGFQDTGLCKTSQSLVLLCSVRLRRRHIYLHHFSSGIRYPGIFYRDYNIHASFCSL